MIILNFVKQNIELIIIIVVILLYIISEYTLRNKLKNLKKLMYNTENEIKEEEYLKYYKIKNILSFLRFGVLFFLITFYILHKLPNFFSFFAIAVGAIIITFKEVITSFFGFFYITTLYKIGDIIIIGEGQNFLRGEIIYINILNIGLVGKDINGENNGQFYRIPNYKFFTEIIKKDEVTLDKYKKEEIIINYSKKDFDISLDDFINKIDEYLNQILPTRNINTVGNFKTYAGYKYKMRLGYEKDGIQIKIYFIVKPKNIFKIEKDFFSFIETFKK